MFQRTILAVLLTASCFAQDKAPNASVARMEQIIQANVPKQFMGTVLVAQDGKVLLDKGYGFANLEWDIPNTPTTKFRLGSITKQFTAASILLLDFDVLALDVFAGHIHPELVDQHEDRGRHRQCKQRTGDTGKCSAGDQ